MHSLKILCLGMACLVFIIAAPCGADIVQYDISGEVMGSFRAVADDPVADLLNVPRAWSGTFPFNWRLVVDTDDAPYVHFDTSAMQQVTYRTPIVSSVLDLNGTQFSTVRRPLQHATPVPPPNMNAPNDEGNVEIINMVNPAATDYFSINLGTYLPEASPLFNDYTVPFNQTINGTLYENVVVGMFRSIVMSNGTGLLDGIAIPTDDEVFNIPYLFGNIQIDLRADWGDSRPRGVTLGGSISDIAISAVPVPAAFWLLGSGLLGLVGFRRRIKK